MDKEVKTLIVHLICKDLKIFLKAHYANEKRKYMMVICYMFLQPERERERERESLCLTLFSHIRKWSMMQLIDLLSISTLLSKEINYLSTLLLQHIYMSIFVILTVIQLSNIIGF